MADNFFVLELDTTGPVIEVFAPTYTVPDVYTEIVIQANEPLMINHEVYIVDQEGKRTNLIFAQEAPDRFVGLVRFGSNVATGICTIYAQVKDEVGNFSNLAEKTIFLKDPAPMKVAINAQTRTPSIKHQTRQTLISHTIRKIRVNSNKRSVSIKTSTRKVEVKMFND